VDAYPDEIDEVEMLDGDVVVEREDVITVELAKIVFDEEPVVETLTVEVFILDVADVAMEGKTVHGEE